MNKKEAIERIQGQIEQINHLLTIKRNSPDFKKWKRNTEVLIENAFGADTRHIKDFNSISYSLSAWVSGTPDSEFQKAYVKGLEDARSVLESLIEEITEYWKSDSVESMPSRKKELTKRTPTNTDLIWEEIKNNFDVDKRTFGKKINFISDSFRRKIIFRDVAHSYHLANNGFSKSAVILAGGVIEELLRLYLVHNEISVGNNKFDEYIQKCTANGLLKSGISKLTDSVRLFRNLVHLERELDKRHTISKATAIGAVSSIFTIVNDF